MTTSSDSLPTDSLPPDPLSTLSNHLADVIAQISPIVVGIQAGRFPASGVYWRPGVIVTTVDAIGGQDQVVLIREDGQSIAATVVGQDAGTDLAVLRLEETTHPTPTLGDLEPLRLGHLVLAVGRSYEGQLRASWGIVAALGGAWQSWAGGTIDRLLRPDISPYPGFAGSPLVDSQGRVLGINTTHSRGRSAITIPLATVNRIVDQLLQKGRVGRGYLGVGLQPVEVTPALQAAIGLDQSVGVLIVSLEADSPAAQAGVLIGDIVLTLGGHPITSIRDLQAQLGSETVGQSLSAVMIRGGQRIELMITVGERSSRIKRRC